MSAAGSAARNFQYTPCRTPNLDELNHTWSPIPPAPRCRTSPFAPRCVATDHQIAGADPIPHESNRDATGAPRVLGVSTQAIDDTLYDAFGQRKIAQFLHPSSTATWVRARGRPRLPPSIQTRLDSEFYVPARERAPGFPLGSLVKSHLDGPPRSRSATRASSPRPTLVFFNLAPGGGV